MLILHTLIVVGVYIKFTYYFIKNCCCSISLLESSVHVQGRDPNIRKNRYPGPRRRTTSCFSVRQPTKRSHQGILPVRRHRGLSTPKSFRRLNGEHIVQCKKKDLKMIKHRTIKPIA
ncbi:hypothetical protein AVEN_100598-1 [Araneus ventricosus]|uniref:Uncharacterized protein n=1 Tax=Araneus ventricosus TaxID=182803 RepID=A0A4Y2VDY7_ARAVE|nr:hypothetical protein AVEN_100598-1 [Araneus ventricosus]